MKRSWKTVESVIVASLLACMLLLTSCGGADNKKATDTSEEDRIAGIIGSMTLEEKAGQMIIGCCPYDGAAEEMHRYHLGGYTFYTQSFNHRDGSWFSREELKDLLDDCGKDMKVAPLFAVDEEGGSVTRLSENPDFFPEGVSKAPRKILEDDGLEGLKEDTAKKSAILKKLGFNVNFAPVADLTTDPDAFMYARSMGGDPDDVGKSVAAMVDLMQDGGIGPVLKHFPGYGNNADTHGSLVRDQRPYEEYLERDYVPFRAGIDAGCEAVMLSHVRVDGIDGSRPASLSSKVVKELRETLDFDGVIMTDDIAMSEMAEDDRDGRVAVEAIKSGNDMVISSNYMYSYDAVLEALESGEITEERIDGSLYRIIRWKLHLGIIT